MITGDEDYRPEVQILLQLIGEEPPPKAWLRGRPLQLLLQRDFQGFEAALAEYRERGHIIRRRDPDDGPPATNP